MEIRAVDTWSNCLFLVPVLNALEDNVLKSLLLEMKELNPSLKIDTLSWQPDKKRAKSKAYVRLVNEINDTDFNWFGKLKNVDVQAYFEANYDSVVVFPSQLPAKIQKLIQQTQTPLKFGFDSNLKSLLDVLFFADSKSFTEKIDLFRHYILQNPQ